MSATLICPTTQPPKTTAPTIQLATGYASTMLRSSILSLTRSALPILLVSAMPAHAQAPAQPPGAVAKTAPAPAAKSKPAAKPEGAAPAPSGGSEGGLRQRVEQLEEQLVDMNVVIGTLESLAKSGGTAAATPRIAAPAGGGGLGASDAARLDGMEMQIKALTSQLEQLAEQMRTMNSQRRSDAGVPANTYAAAPPPPAPPASGGFGTTAVTPGGDPIGSLLAGGGMAGMAAPVTAAPAAAGGDPKALYETAYGHFLQQDYGAAEVAFDDFVKRYPSDSLAGNAQYWLGEAHFVRGQYKQAAASFLKGYQTYAKGSKAPDSLLKLAMSLDRLGQKEPACSAYGELSARYPAAPSHIKSKVQTERTRLACT